MGHLVETASLDVFRGKRVLVTGHTGFKGSWLALWLHSLGAEVTGYALPPVGEENHFQMLGLERVIHHVAGDIRDLDSLLRTFRTAQPEIVFHLAAQPLVRYSYQEPKLTYDTNIGGSINILEAVRATESLRALVYITSDKCYRNKEWVWGYRETDELGGYDPYSASKAAAEIVFASYMDSYFRQRAGFGAASVRAGNVIGGGDWSADRIVPDCARSLRAGKAIVLRSPDATRPWQHVLDPLYGYLLTASHLLADPAKYSGSYNFGPETRSIRTVRELTLKMVECWGEGEVIIDPPANAPYESTLLHLNCDKAHSLLRWSPQWAFDRAVTETARWYRLIHDGEAPSAVSRQQINLYMENR